MNLIRPFIDAEERRLRELADLRKKGRKVIGFFCLHTPAALIEAAGGIPLRLCLRGDSVVQRTGEILARNCICPFIKACLGHLAKAQPWFASVDAIAVGSACDQMRHMADVWRRKFQIPSFVFFQPRGIEKKAGGWIYQQELRWLFRELSAFCDVHVSKCEMRDIIAGYNLIHRHLLAVHELRAGAAPPISGEEWLNIVRAGFVLNSRSYLGLMEGLIKEIAGRNVRERAAVRIMLVGGMLAQGDERIVQAVEDTGRAAVITDALCTGTRAIGDNISVEGDLIDNIIAAQRAKVPCIHARPNQALYEYIDRQVKQFRVDGIVFHTLKFCDGWGSEWFRMRQFLKQRAIPSIAIDTDYGAADTGQLATRIGAFLEMLREMKDDRG